MERKYQKVLRWKEILVVVLSFGMIIGGALWGTARVEATEKISNPRIEKDSSMVSGQNVTWDCVWFGSYPQNEIVRQGSSQETILKDMKKKCNIDYTVVDDNTFHSIESASYNKNGDAIVNGKKYRRINASDVTARLNDIEYCNGLYNWNNDYSSYHYFEYQKIKWRVLEVKNNHALLLSDIMLDDQEYNKDCIGDITWKTSTMRSWLNGYAASENGGDINYQNKNFINTAFSKEEENAIINTDRDYTDYENDGIKVNTNDKIFLLSGKDVHNTENSKKYGFSDVHNEDEARRCKCSTYGLAMGTNLEWSTYGLIGNGDWWLAPLGVTSGPSSSVDHFGWVSDSGTSTDDTEGGVRPALNINLSSSAYSSAGTVSSEEAAIKYPWEGFSYTEYGDSVEITGFYSDSKTDVVIPDKIYEKPVTSIAEHAFTDAVLTSLTIPKSINRVYDEAFKNAKITNVYFDMSLEELLQFKFNLEWETCQKGAIFVKENGKYKKIENLIVPEGIQKIEDHVLSGCDSLISVKLPNSIKTIGYGEFAGCNNLVNINIPNSVSSIDKFTFTSCKSLKSIKLPDTIKQIGCFAFEDCSQLTSIYLPENITTIEVGAFDGCSSLKTIKIPASITNIESLTFDGCRSLQSVDVPDNVTEIGSYAFRECDKLSNVTLGKNIKKIEYGAFLNCSMLKSVTIPKGITEIEKRALGYNYNYNTDEYAKTKNFEINCYKDNSVAINYAKENGFKYRILDADKSNTQIPANNNKNPNSTVGNSKPAKNIPVPSKVKINKLFSTKKKVTLNIKKASNSAKYQVQFSLKKNMKKASIKTFKGIKYTIKKLKSKKTYYIRVRGINNKGKAGAWSQVKKIKVK